MSKENSFQPVITAKVTLHITLRPTQYGPAFSLEQLMHETRQIVQARVQEMLSRSGRADVGADVNNITFDLQLKDLKVSG